MWLFTKYGFYSAVCARQGNGSYEQPVNPDQIMVRARLRSHLESLQQHFSDLLADCAIREFVGTDYAFRIFIPKVTWSQILVRLSEEMDYDNFKSKVAQHQGVAGADYEHSLHNVWSVMNRLQK